MGFIAIGESLLSGLKLLVSILGGVRAAIFFSLALCFLITSHHWQAKYQAEVAKRVSAEHAAQVAVAKLKDAQAKVTERVITKYVDRVKVVQGRTRTIIKEIPTYVPAATPDLPGGLRVLLDSAAQGVIPDPAGIADAAPVPAQDLAESVISNYGTCHETEAQLTSLQDWIRGQQAIH